MEEITKYELTVEEAARLFGVPIQLLRNEGFINIETDKHSEAVQKLRKRFLRLYNKAEKEKTKLLKDGKDR